MDVFWLIPFAPALSAAFLAFFGGKLSRKTISGVACSSVGVAFAISVYSVVRLLGNPESYPRVKVLLAWIHSGALQADIAFQFDPLTAVMVLVVSGVGLIIHVYSIGYMEKDRSYARYFLYLNLFTFFMLLLVGASNILLMFVGWEGVGLCSYLLIGFWFERPAAAEAGKKALIVNRVGDAAFLMGTFLLLAAVGSGEFLAIGGASAEGKIGASMAGLIGILLFAGATGKSAQIPLYVWLPDAMEGPTPVSALIHAATMVTAGVYMVARLSPVYALSVSASEVVAVVGAATAVFAATIALTQNDIKKVLAYSTISQIGYMFLGCGVGAYAAGMFHLFTHAFFKSLLFLAAGSVIHALSGEQDMRKMGGLRKVLPRTFWPFMVGAIAIAGVPFFSGFFSKDAILSKAYENGQHVLWAMGVAGAVMTAFYIFRLIFLVFYGEKRVEGEAEKHFHESPPVMTVPLAVLAVFSAIAGYVGLPLVLGERADWFRRFVGRAVAAGGAAHEAHAEHMGAGTEWLLIGVSTAAALLGIWLAYRAYIRQPALPHSLVRKFPWAYKLLVNKYYVDEIYQGAVVRPLVKGSELVYDHFDLKVIDGTVHGTGRAADRFGGVLSRVQSGLIRDYGFLFLLGLTLALGYLLF